MHLSGYPKYYIKDGKRRAVYYTAEARDLLSLGWEPEADSILAAPELKEETETILVAEEKQAAEFLEEEVFETIEAELVPAKEDSDSKVTAVQLPDFEFMTKVELLQYALDRGVDLPNNTLKAELVKACQELADV